MATINTLKKVELFLKESGEFNSITQIIRGAGIDYYSLKEILEYLKKEEKIIERKDKQSNGRIYYYYKRRK